MKVKRVIGWILFSVGIPYLFIAPATVKAIADSTGNAVFGGMSLQIGIAFFSIALGWGLAHPKKKNEE